jgi:hypothetical protein
LAQGANLPGVAFRAHANLAILKGEIYGLQAACDESQHAVQLGRQAGNVVQEMLAPGNQLEAWLALGELAQAQAALSRVRWLAGEFDDPSSWRERIRRLEATVLLHLGEWFQSASLLRLCQADSREQGNLRGLYGADWLLARALLEAYTLLPCPDPCDWGRAADLSRAHSLLQESLTLFQEMGIPRYVELVQERWSALPSQA